MENSSRDGTTRPPDLPPEKSVCRSRSNSQNQTWNNLLVPNGERGTSRLYIVNLLIYFHAEYIIQNAGLDEAQAVIKISGRNINDLIYTDDTTLMAKKRIRTKSLLMKVKEENEKAGLKLSFKKLRS